MIFVIRWLFDHWRRYEGFFSHKRHKITPFHPHFTRSIKSTDFDFLALLELTKMNFDNLLNPIVTIRGVKTGKYICCNLDGKCFGNKRLEQECYFEEIYTSSRFYVFRPRECQVIFQ